MAMPVIEAKPPEGEPMTMTGTPTKARTMSKAQAQALIDAYDIDSLLLDQDELQLLVDNQDLLGAYRHQMILAHKTSFQLADQAMHERDGVGAARLIKASARL